MALLALRPSADAVEARHRLEQLIDDMWDDEASMRRPAIDVVDGEDAILVRAELPGMRPDEVKVELQDNVLTIRGQHEESSEEKGQRYVRRERRAGAFARSIALPAGTDASAISAACQDGVLEVRIPHVEKTEPATIEVQAKS